MWLFCVIYENDRLTSPRGTSVLPWVCALTGDFYCLIDSFAYLGRFLAPEPTLVNYLGGDMTMIKSIEFVWRVWLACLLLSETMEGVPVPLDSVE